MSNPFFSRSAAFQEGGRVEGSAPTQTPNGYPTMPGYQAGQYGQYGQQAAGYGQQAGRFGGGEIDGHGASSVIALGVRLAMLGKGITRLHRAAPVLSEALLTKP